MGTGAAIEIGKRGDADAVMVHARELELKAVEEGWFKDRHDLMYKDLTGDPILFNQYGVMAVTRTNISRPSTKRPNSSSTGSFPKRAGRP